MLGGKNEQTRKRRWCLNVTDVSCLKCSVSGFKRKHLQQQNSRESIANIDCTESLKCNMAGSHLQQQNGRESIGNIDSRATQV